MRKFASSNWLYANFFYHKNGAPAPTLESISSIEKHFGCVLPVSLIRFCQKSEHYGDWLASIGPDFESAKHITEEEALAIRDNAACIAIPVSVIGKLEEARGYADLTLSWNGGSRSLEALNW